MAYFKILLIFCLVSCAPRPSSDKTRVYLKLPSSGKSQALKLRSLSSTSTTGQLTDIDDVDCYGIMVSWDGLGGICKNTSGVGIISANEVFGFIPQGGIIDIEVSSGPGRVFYLVAISHTSTVCPDLITYPISDRGQSSHLTIVGQQTANLVEGQDVELQIDASLTGSEIIEDCTGTPFLWEASSTGAGVWDSTIWDNSLWGL